MDEVIQKQIDQLQADAMSAGRNEERLRIKALLLNYLETRWNPPNAVALWMRGERELVLRIIQKIDEGTF